jgi:hypothetical protein
LLPSTAITVQQCSRLPKFSFGFRNLHGPHVGTVDGKIANRTYEIKKFKSAAASSGKIIMPSFINMSIGCEVERGTTM